MNRINLIDSFLKLIVEISKNDIAIDFNLVYSNLVTFGVKNENITHYFDMWISNFEKIRNINIVKEKTYIKFNSFNLKNNSKKIKLYMAFSKEHIYKSVNDIIEFLSKNNIIHSTKIYNSVRNDNVIIEVEDLFSAEKIRKFISSNEYIRNSLLAQNPFMFTDNYVSFVWDGYLTYNIVLSEWISDYVNYHIDNRLIDLVNFNDFLDYLKDRYLNMFINGIGINKFISNRNFVNVPVEILNYKYITEIIIKVLNPNVSIKDFCDLIKNIDMNDLDNIKKLIINDKDEIDITIEQKEIFDCIYVDLSKKYGEHKTIQLFKKFIKMLDYRVFTRKNNIRNLLITNKITPLVMKNIIYEEMKMALINASIETTKKYDVLQLGRALYGIKKGDYSSFTNEKNVRNNLRLMVEKDEIDELLETFLDSKCNSIDDKYWLFIELINKKLK